MTGGTTNGRNAWRQLLTIDRLSQYDWVIKGACEKSISPTFGTQGGPLLPTAEGLIS